MKVAAIIQARMGSTRLPGKTMKPLLGKPVLEHVIERVKQSGFLNQVIIATTVLERDNPIVEQAVKSGVSHFRGSENDVLSRYYLAARENKADVVVRITSDCPLIDPFVIDDIVKFYLEHEYEMVTNAGADLNLRTYPRGLDTEVFSFCALEEAFNNAQESYQREHVTPYIYENTNRVYYFKSEKNNSKYRWTLDTPEDFEMIRVIYDNLYHGVHDFYLKDILRLLAEQQEISKINEMIEQKNMK